LQNAVVEKNISPLELSTPSYEVSKLRDSLREDGETKVLVSVQGHADVIIVLQKRDLEPLNTSLITINGYLTGEKLSRESTEASPDIRESFMTRWFARPFAYVFLREEGEAWVGDTYELRNKMASLGYPRWYLNLMDILWTLDMAYGAIAERISMIFQREE
jgi:hypothetical protein